MRPILLDTNGYSAFKVGDPPILQILQSAEVIVMSPVVLGELLGGFANGNREKQNREELQKFLASSRVQIFPITADTAVFYGQIYVQLKKGGKPIPSNDIWIAAQALEHGCVLCSYDHHFEEVQGLISGHSLLSLGIL